MLKRVSLYLMSAAYVAAGINHFRVPDFYTVLIPPYLPRHDIINSASGVIEIMLGVLLLFPKTRKLAAYGIIAMLIAFIPAHIHHIQYVSAGCPPEVELCIAPWKTWVRLLVLHPLLLAWAWSNRN